MATLTEAQAKVLRLLVDYDMSFDNHDMLKFAQASNDDCDILSEAELIERDMHWGNWHITAAGRAALAAYDTEQALKQHGAHDAATVDALHDIQLTGLQYRLLKGLAWFECAVSVAQILPNTDLGADVTPRFCGSAMRGMVDNGCVSVSYASGAGVYAITETGKRALETYVPPSVSSVPDASKDAENEALKQRVAALEGALRPFARAASDRDVEAGKDSQFLWVLDKNQAHIAIAANEGEIGEMLKIIHLREAAQVLWE